MSANVFGTPVFIYSADDPSNKVGGEDKDSTVANRLQNALKAVKPLDSARLALQKALDSLDGTAYDELKKGIQACMAHVSQAEKTVVEQLGMPNGNEMQATAKPSANVPTAGQMAGTEPLPQA